MAAFADDDAVCFSNDGAVALLGLLALGCATDRGAAAWCSGRPARWRRRPAQAGVAALERLAPGPAGAGAPDWGSQARVARDSVWRRRTRTWRLLARRGLVRWPVARHEGAGWAESALARAGPRGAPDWAGSGRRRAGCRAAAAGERAVRSPASAGWGAHWRPADAAAREACPEPDAGRGGACSCLCPCRPLAALGPAPGEFRPRPAPKATAGEAPWRAELRC